MKAVFFIVTVLLSMQLMSQEVDFRFFGLKIFVEDTSAARKFYSKSLGFKMKDSLGFPIITGEAFPIFFEKGKVHHESDYPESSRTGLVVYVDKLLPEIDRLRDKNVKIYDKLLERNGVGIAIPFEDNSGNVLGLMEVQVFDVGRFSGLKVYNCGVTISDMDKALGFYRDFLGFKEWSRNYLPAAIPLKNVDSSFAFMIHYEKGRNDNTSGYGDFPQMRLMFSVIDLEQAEAYFMQKGHKVYKLKDFILLQDPFGNWIEVHSNIN